jgi:hypothetical protein
VPLKQASDVIDYFNDALSYLAMANYRKHMCLLQFLIGLTLLWDLSVSRKLPGADAWLARAGVLRYLGELFRL